MAAKSLESSNRVFQKAFGYLQAIGAREESFKSLRALKQYLATYAGNPQLQFVTFSDVTTDQATALTTGGATLYYVFVKKQNTATDAFFKWADHGSTAGGANGANMQATLPLLVGKDEIDIMLTPGLILATGLTVASETTAAGGADTTSGDGPNGFAIIG